MAASKLIRFDDRLFFTTFPSPVPSQLSLNQTSASSSTYHRTRQSTKFAAGSIAEGAQTSSPPPSSSEDEKEAEATESIGNTARDSGVKNKKDRSKMHWLCVDEEFIYQSFSGKDFGPLNLAMVFRFCVHIHEIMQDPAFGEFSVVLYTSTEPTKKANAALLMALYVMMVNRKNPWEAFHPIAHLEFMPFRDAGRGPGDFNLSIQDCLYGVWKALNAGLLRLDDFNEEEYLYYEQVQNGDFNHVSKDFIAFASPQDNNYVRSLTDPKSVSSFPTKKLARAYTNVLNYFADHNVKLVVRLNNPLYDKQDFESRGMEFKDMYFDDGTNPPEQMVREFLKDADRVISAGGVIAIHCKAGLGRTGCLIAAWLVYRHDFTATEAIGFMRICRPGMVVGPQQQYILLNHLTWVKWAAADAAVAAYQASERASSALANVSRTLTPPNEPNSSDGDRRPLHNLPNVTPCRHARTADNISPPLQPRKTPLAKRTATALEEDMDDDPLGRLPPDPYRSQRMKPASVGPLVGSPTRQPINRTNGSIPITLPPSSPSKKSNPASVEERARRRVAAASSSRIAVPVSRSRPKVVPATESRVTRSVVIERKLPGSPTPRSGSLSKASAATVGSSPNSKLPTFSLGTKRSFAGPSAGASTGLNVTSSTKTGVLSRLAEKTRVVRRRRSFASLWSQIVSTLRALPAQQDFSAHKRFQAIMDEGGTDSEIPRASRDLALRKLEEEERIARHELQIYESAAESLSILLALRTESPPSTGVSHFSSKLKTKSTHQSPQPPNLSNTSTAAAANADLTGGNPSTSTAGSNYHLSSSSSSVDSTGSTSTHPRIPASHPVPFSKRDSRERKQTYAAQLPLTPGRRVAFKMHQKPAGVSAADRTDEPDEGEGWILAVVKRCLHQDTNRLTNTTFKTLIPLPDPTVPANHPSHPNAYAPHPVGSFVMAIFPDTTSFYKAVVRGSVKAKPTGLAKYLVTFDDDDNQVREMDVSDVVEWPGGQPHQMQIQSSSSSSF
ncbi:phosphoprotein phosphatase [Phaffia rhodozyma]|uniref:protein-tyrosine-phosphatase n=1 Tax=Phaffia rhodozyma TaxID=264483 RepID=A0A0F7SNA1_PHARH|nr:phosphoprotein phosphatase [Phaffia rhodozyma]